MDECWAIVVKKKEERSWRAGIACKRGPGMHCLPIARDEEFVFSVSAPTLDQLRARLKQALKTHRIPVSRVEIASPCLALKRRKRIESPEAQLQASP